jgi:hypothetical protein
VTISANSDWLPEWDSVIGMSLRLAGLVPMGKSPSAPQIAHAREFLDSFLKSLKSTSQILLHREMTTTTLTTGTVAYVLPADTIEIDGPMMLTATGDTTQTQVDKIEYEKYESIVDKQTTGLPVWCYAEKLAGTTLRFWPVPNKTYVAAYRRQRLIRNADSGTTPDVAANWIRGISFQLAADMGRAGSMDQSTINDRQGMADRLMADAKSQEIDHVDMQIVLPDYR